MDFNDFKGFNIVIKVVRLTFIVIGGINNEEEEEKQNWKKSFKEKKN